MVAIAPQYPAPGCPDRAKLVEFDLGLLGELELESVGEHLSSCDHCEGVLRDLHSRSDDDPVLQKLKRSMEGPPTPTEPACARMEAVARALGLSGMLSGSGLDDPVSGLDLDSHPSFGRYELLEKLGQGGMGVVYRARQTSLDRPVALKMVLAGHYAGTSAVARFNLEGKAIARLRHPNIVQVYELGEHDGLPFLSMELLEGGSLRARLRRGPMAIREAAELLRTLALAVAYAHDEGVVHRDLTPANILYERDGLPKITDFGLAKLLDPDSDDSDEIPLTGTGTVLGTAQYMAPEQAEGRPGSSGTSADVYSLGAILYETLTGRPPFVGETKLEIIDLVRRTEPVPPSRLRPGIPYWLESICLKCLEKSPERRYDSALSLATDLDRWLRDERPQGVPNVLRRVTRYLRKHTLIGLLGLAALAAAAGAYIRDPDRSMREIRSELAKGRPVTLVNKTGMPRWFRWITGSATSHVIPDNAGTFRLTSFSGIGLVELVPDPQWRSYRFAAQIRHDMADRMSGVGLYVGRRVYRHDGKDVHFFTAVDFNVVESRAERLRLLPGPRGRFSPPITNTVRFRPHLYSDQTVLPNIDVGLPGAEGIPYQALGNNNGRWNDLQVIVTPTTLTTIWNGQTCPLPISEIERSIVEDSAKGPGLSPMLIPQGLRPSFEARGGLGIYIRGSIAAYRSISLTPL